MFKLELVLCQIVLNFIKDLVKDYCNNIKLMIKKLDDNNLLIRFKKHSQFKNMEFKKN